MTRLPVLSIICIVALAPLAAYGADPQFHIVTAFGNTFPISPPDMPRPANIIGETAYLAVHNPPAGMFILTAGGGTIQTVAPLQSGIDTDGFAGGKLRIILGSDWDAASDRAFRDQAFGYMVGSPMYHGGTMPLASGWNNSYTHVALQDTSAFGLGSVGANNALTGSTSTTNGGYMVQMGSRERAGLDFGPGTGQDKTYYIYRGCSSCKALAAIGHGDPTDKHETLPNSRLTTDHDRGWKSTGSCSASKSTSWSGSGSSTVTATYSLPSPRHSNAGDHHVNSRYDDLSVLPTSHNSCSGTEYSDDTDDNRKHDMCITNTSSSTSTTHKYTYTKTVRVEKYVNWTLTSDKTTTTTGSTSKSGSGGSCTMPTTTLLSSGYKVVTTCTGGSTHTAPVDTSTTTTTGTAGTGTFTTTTKTYSGPTTTTYGSVGATCTRSSNTPHLDLDAVMSLQPGLNLYRPSAIPASHDILVVYDDAEGGGGGTERIQIYSHDGLGAEPAGPYNFYLRPAASGVLYDPHSHYGWVGTGMYDSDDLADMGYTQLAALAGLDDGEHPFPSVSRVCHGDCFLGPEGIDSAKPAIREVAAASERTVTTSSNTFVYDHINDRWFESWYGKDKLATAASLYLTIPFAEDASLHHVRMYDDGFDPARQAPPARLTAGMPCHIHQAGQIGTFANSMNATNGESVHIPVIPGMRYAAFISNGECHWYDVAALPSPLSTVSAGARHVALANGTLLAGDLTARHDGHVHVDVVMDIEAVWQSEMHGLTAAGTGNVTWVVPPLEVNVTAVARVNGAHGDCGANGVYCSDVIGLAGTARDTGTYIHGAATYGGSPFVHGKPYAERELLVALTGTTGRGVYGLSDGRCYGLEAVRAGTDGVIVRDIPFIAVSAGDTVTLSFEADVRHPKMVGGNVTVYGPVTGSNKCLVTGSVESSVLDVTMLRATLR